MQISAGRGGGGEHEPRPPPRPRPPGLIGGGGDDDEEHGGLSLECDKGKTRGTSAGCRVEAGRGRSLDSMAFQWQALPGGKFHEGRGEEYSSWDGAATENRKFWLEIAEGRRLSFLTDSVTVRPRSWSLQERSAVEEYEPLPLLGEDEEVWGIYEWGGLDSLLETSQGSGPWEGSYYVSSQPKFGDAWLHVNEKFVGDPAYELPREECGVPKGDSINIPDLNEECDIWTALDNFRLQVVDHEHEHQNSLNKCIRTVNSSARFEAVESIVGETGAAAQDSARIRWTDGLRPALDSAMATNQVNERSADAFWWRRLSWVKANHGIKGHSGTDGCPQI
ncbi:MAG: hypothetical protein J4F34_05525 [Gemmatimonadetes bacterium]|nr:hypothetical protein [Gemmatimonadota bacterium]